MTPQFTDIKQLKRGDLFTVFQETGDELPVEGKIARGRIFRLREVAYPYIFASHRPIQSQKWIDSPWRLDMSEGIKLIRLTPNALFKPLKHASKKPKH